MADINYYFFVEHSVKDKEKWFMQLYAEEGMTVDKALQHPDWEGNECLLTCSSVDGDWTCCLWKAPNKTLQEFQGFIDRFTGDAVTNKTYVVEGGFGLKHLNTRGYIRDLINASQGRSSPGFLDGDKFWMVHHKITDREAWNNDFTFGIAKTINDKCATPSDCKMLFDKGCGAALTLFLSDNTSVCFESTPKDMTKEEFQKVCDKFTKGTAVNTLWLINDEQSVNVMNLSLDTWNQETFAWGNAQNTSKVVDSIGTEMPEGVNVASQ
eukprot:CCRYP_003065-RB/>CCRYP_003065-RB protein AED:0.09 eAED:0.09 QI:73/0.66/0.75/1/0.66/0.5/4/73/266